jgi:hypothetical protein
MGHGSLFMDGSISWEDLRVVHLHGSCDLPIANRQAEVTNFIYLPSNTIMSLNSPESFVRTLTA